MDEAQTDGERRFDQWQYDFLKECCGKGRGEHQMLE